MSTFKGIVQEFPGIQIDYFRRIPNAVPPLACFLSHVHSDHLQGLESLKSPFVYCSPATRELLLRLERYQNRINLTKGILESRIRHYKHLKNILKTIPLDTPTEIELGPERNIRVTLLDANHCVGAVMFLIEDAEKAILYTGDIRSEPWWVNALIRNPTVAPYTLGFRQLDKIYLDTTFARVGEKYRSFPSKSEGIKELLSKVSAYPADTIFHFHAWTFGYEDVWVALSAALSSKIHVDRYKLALYKSLTASSSSFMLAPEGPALSGFSCGNRRQSGCLTDDETVRLHSCEKETGCARLSHAKNVVWITPIITRTTQGAAFPEAGAGGGAGDLAQHRQLQFNDLNEGARLVELCSQKIKNPKKRSKALRLISSILQSKHQCLPIEAFSVDDNSSIKLDEFAQILGNLPNHQNGDQDYARLIKAEAKPPKDQQSLSRHVQFPYSRHSSYDELCHLVKIFQPGDLYPCTTDEENWHPGVSMEALFGHLCHGTVFCHDVEMRALANERNASNASPRGQKRSFAKISSGNAREALHNLLGIHSQECNDDLDTTMVNRDLSSLDALRDSLDSRVLDRIWENMGRSAKDQSSGLEQMSWKLTLCPGASIRGKPGTAPRNANVSTNTLPRKTIEVSEDCTKTFERPCQHDLALEDVSNCHERKQVFKLVQMLDCSVILARTIVRANCYPPSREFLMKANELGNRCSTYEDLLDRYKDKELVDKLQGLRDVLGTASDETCHKALLHHNGNYVKARDQVASEEEIRLAALNLSVVKNVIETGGIPPNTTEPEHQLGSIGRGVSGDNRLHRYGVLHGAYDNNSNIIEIQQDSQISLTTTAFESQERQRQLHHQTQSSPSQNSRNRELSTIPSEKLRIIRRKDAYKAVTGIKGRSWHVASPISSMTAHTEEEVEL